MSYWGQSCGENQRSLGCSNQEITWLLRSGARLLACFALTKTLKKLDAQLKELEMTRQGVQMGWMMTTEN